MVHLLVLSRMIKIVNQFINSVAYLAIFLQSVHFFIACVSNQNFCQTVYQFLTSLRVF